MVEGRREEQWEHTAHLLAKLHNLFAKSPVSPDDVNPLKWGRKKRQEPRVRAGIEIFGILHGRR